MERIRGPLLAFLLGLGGFLWGYNRENIDSAWASLSARFDSAPPPSATPELPTEEIPGAETPPPEAENTESTEIESGKNTAIFSESLEGIQPGKVEDRSKQKRNAYFEHLSEQLKTLQGDQPEENEAAGASPPQPEPQEVSPPTPTFPPGYPPPMPTEIESEPTDEITEIDEPPPMDDFAQEGADDVEEVLDDLEEE